MLQCEFQLYAASRGCSVRCTLQGLAPLLHKKGEFPTDCGPVLCTEYYSVLPTRYARADPAIIASGEKAVAHSAKRAIGSFNPDDIRSMIG